MRKKYLSALLFGALLFASAGTFTSCKDYDDDINNLQEQINTVVSDLNSLKSQIGDKGVSSVTFDEATGVLTVVDADGTHTYTIKTSAGEVADIKVTIDGQNLVVNGETVGKVGDTVTINEDGYLCINGEATAIQAGKYAILENVSDNTYTISLPDKDGNMQTIQLLRAIPTNIRVEVEENLFFTEGDSYQANTATTTSVAHFVPVSDESGKGIYWGEAEKDIDWANVKKGQLLVGQINEIPVKVTPSNTELDTQVLKLVDSEGNIAPVTIHAVPQNAGVLHSDSRSIDKGGQWMLSVTMTNDVTLDNIETAFATKSNSVWYNKRYALSVNGEVVTDYSIRVDTRREDSEINRNEDITLTPAKIKVGDVSMGRIASLEVSGSSTPITNGYTPAKLEGTVQQVSFDLNKSYKLTYVDPKIANYKFEIYDGDIEDAKLWGISINDNEIVANDAAAGKTVRVTTTILTINGKEIKAEANQLFAVKFGTTKVDAEDITPVTYSVPAKTLDANSYIGIDLGSTFSALTSEQATSLTGVTWEVDGEDKFILAENNLNGAVTYYASASDAAQNKNKINTTDEANQVKKIAYAKIALNGGALNSNAKAGTYNLILTLKAATGEIKKVKVPVTINVPTFDQLFEQKTSVWKDGTLYANIDGSGKVNMLAGYTLKQDVMLDKGLTLSFSKVKNSSNKEVLGVQENAEGNGLGAFADTKLTINDNQNASIQISEDAIDDNKLLVLQATPSYKVQGIYEVKGSKFNINLVTALEGAKIVNYVNGVETSPLVIKTFDGIGEVFNAFTPAQGNNKKAGIALVIGGSDYALNGTVNGLTLNGTWTSKFGDAVTGTPSATVAAGKLTIKVDSPAAGSYLSTLTLSYPVVSVGGTTLNKDITIDIKVGE